MTDATGHNEAYLLSRAEHYGTQTADTVSDLHDTVIGYNLNEFAGWAHAVQDSGDQLVDGVKTLGDRLEMNGHKITTLANPSANCGDAANSAYVDSGSTTLVRVTGDQHIGGAKNFDGDVHAGRLAVGGGAYAGSRQKFTGAVCGTYGRETLLGARGRCISCALRGGRLADAGFHRRGAEETAL